MISVIAEDPSALTFNIPEGSGVAVPRSLLTVIATDIDGDTITYAINPPSVSCMQLTLYTIVAHTYDIDQSTTTSYKYVIALW